ncbi:MAG TPA: hypothetical protein VN734_08710 [Acidobacteriaceae bacterium]|nr:hypothetical protein [Acidobacteriaceae bacterium]
MAIEQGISGPHVQSAFLCEKVLTERDNVPSFIRVVERFTVPIAPPLPPGVVLPQGTQFPQPTLQFFLVVALKAGSLPAGSYIVSVTLNKPDGSSLPKNDFQVFFNGSDDNGIAVIAPITMPNPEAGLYWFDVYFEQALITRIPMRVLHQQMQVIFPQQ